MVAKKTWQPMFEVSTPFVVFEIRLREYWAALLHWYEAAREVADGRLLALREL
jgi:hypothetical protein